MYSVHTVYPGAKRTTATLHTVTHSTQSVMYSVQRIQRINGQRLHCIPLLTQGCTVQCTAYPNAKQKTACLHIFMHAPRVVRRTTYLGAKRHTKGDPAYLYIYGSTHPRELYSIFKGYTAWTRPHCMSRSTMHVQVYTAYPGFHCIPYKGKVNCILSTLHSQH